MLIEKLFLNKISIMKNYPAPIFEDDYKLQAILLYARERINDSISLHKDNELKFKNDSTLLDEFKFESTYVYSESIKLFAYLNTILPSLDEIEKIMLEKNKSKINQIKYTEVVKVGFYYNKIVSFYENILLDELKPKMILPDMLAFSLINGWYIEASKKTTTYLELFEKFDFNQLLSKFNEISIKKKNTKYSVLIKDTYTITDKIIIDLNHINYFKDFFKKLKTNKKSKKIKKN